MRFTFFDNFSFRTFSFGSFYPIALNRFNNKSIYHLVIDSGSLFPKATWAIKHWHYLIKCKYIEQMEMETTASIFTFAIRWDWRRITWKATVICVILTANIQSRFFETFFLSAEWEWIQTNFVPHRSFVYPWKLNSKNHWKHW